MLNYAKMPEFLASRGEEFNPGPESRLDHSELLCKKVLLKYKGEKASDTCIRRGQKEYPLASIIHGVIHSQIGYYSESKECLEVVKTSPDLLT